MLLLKALFCLGVAYFIGNVGVVAMGMGFGIPALAVAAILFILL